MPDRNFATTFKVKGSGDESRLHLLMVPREPIEGLPQDGISLELKKGATEAQAMEVSSLLNLLAVRLVLADH